MNSKLSQAMARHRIVIELVKVGSADRYRVKCAGKEVGDAGSYSGAEEVAVAKIVALDRAHPAA